MAIESKKREINEPVVINCTFSDKNQFFLSIFSGKTSKTDENAYFLSFWSENRWKIHMLALKKSENYVFPSNRLVSDIFHFPVKLKNNLFNSKLVLKTSFSDFFQPKDCIFHLFSHPKLQKFNTVKFVFLGEILISVGIF